MSYCPVCKSEFREGFTICSDCGRPLVDQLPEDREPEYFDHVDWVTLTSVGNSIEANSLEALLRSFDIPVLVKPIGAGGYMEVYMGFTGLGVDIYVPQGEIERASEVIQAYTKKNYVPCDDNGDSAAEFFHESFDGYDEIYATKDTRAVIFFKWFLRIGICVNIVFFIVVGILELID